MTQTNRGKRGSGGTMPYLRKNPKKIILVKPHSMRTREPKVRILLQKGTLTKGMQLKPGVKFFGLPVEQRKEQYVKLAKQHGEQDVVGKLHALSIMNKNRDPVLSKQIAEDRTWVAKSFDGKKFKGGEM